MIASVFPNGWVRKLALISAASLVFLGARLGASDHADPLVLNPLKPPTVNEPRITDLHVFLDSDQNGSAGPSALVLSLCAFPSLPPLKTEMRDGVTVPVLPELDLEGYRYTIHLDLGATISYGDAGDLARYGGTIDRPKDISSEVSISFELNDDATVKDFRVGGFKPGRTVINGDFDNTAVNVRSGIFDDPFIFPMFFRSNVIGVVISIPLERLPSKQKEFLVWAASTKNGEQLDHVGRSVRTQLPRFDGLNTLSPEKHYAEINRYHEDPSLGEDFRRTFLSPLFGRRVYDTAPDVVIFTRENPTLFPNGRKLDDDVGGILGRWGEAQVLEASYTVDPTFPREEKNDKEFLSVFPYLAPPWTTGEASDDPTPFPPIGRATLTDGSWRLLWVIEIVLVVIMILFLIWLAQARVIRIGLIVLGAVVVILLQPVFSKNLPAGDTSMEAFAQPGKKLDRVILGAVVIVGLGIVSIYGLGRRNGIKQFLSEKGFPAGDQAVTLEDRQYSGSNYDEIRREVMDRPYYQVWGGRNEKPLPVYPVTLSSLVKGLFRGGRAFKFLQAQKRTLTTRADMRWGSDGKGTRRLLHPNGICLAGEWSITDSPKGVSYTGCFRPGTKLKIIARYSTCCTETRAGHWRSLSMVGKIFPDEKGASDGSGGNVFPATFFTQEDLGGTATKSILEAVLTNSPPVSIWRRGKGVFSFLVTIVTFFKSDKMPSERQLYELSELGEPEGNRTSCPRFMRLTVATEIPDAPEEIDFRDEVMGAIYDRGDPAPKRKLAFSVEVSDEGERKGKLVQRLTGLKWTYIGKIEFGECAASHNGDFVIHFPHPPWREDRNDPSSVTRPELRKVKS